MQNISVNIVLREDRAKQERFPLYIRIVSDRKKIDVRVGHFVYKHELEPNGLVKHKTFNSFLINADIQNCLTEVNKVILFHRLNDLTFTPVSFSNLFYKKTDTSKLFLFIRTQAKQLPISGTRLIAYNSLAKHIENNFPSLSLADCDYSFLLKLEKTLLEKIKLAQNTVSQNMSKLRAILNIAFKKKFINENPFIHYKIKAYTSNRKYLTREELLKIEKYYESVTGTQKNITAIFLFLCYTGLRIGDFQTLNITDLKNGNLEFLQHKTKQLCTVPLNVPARRFINNEQFLFKKISGQKINVGLKILKKNTNIDKPITCHIARHTFATLCLQLNMDLLSISKILGHTDIKTTLIYAKLLNETKQKEMAKWDNFLG